MIEKITKEEHRFMDSWRHPRCKAETLFSNLDDLGEDGEGLSDIRTYQMPMLSYESLIDFKATAKLYNLNRMQTFQLRKNVADIYNLGGRSYGKCEYVGNHCTLTNGARVQYKELIGKTANVFSLNEKTLKLEESEAAIYDNGLQPCYKMTTRTGKEIIVTSNHPFLTDTGWKQAIDLTGGEYLATPRRIPVKHGKKADQNLAKLLGYLLGDGSTSHPNAVGFTNIDEELIEEYHQLADYYNCAVRKNGISYYVKKKDYVRAHYEKGVGNIKGEKQHYNDITKLVLKYKIDTLAKHKTMPEEVFLWDTNSIATLLNRLYACDGHVNLHNNTVEIGLASKEMIYQIQNLLLRFEIQSYISYTKVKLNDKLFDSWRLTVAQDFDKFLNIIGVKSKDNGTRKNKKFTISDQIPNKFILDMYDQLDGKKEFGLRKLKLYSPTRAKCQNISKKTKNDELSRIANSDIYWDKVKSIEYVGELPTATVSVPKNNNYISNDIISHNSLITLKIDIALSAITDAKQRSIFYSIDEKRLRGILDDVKKAFEYHSFFIHWGFKCQFRPDIKFYSKKNGWTLTGVNMALQGKEPGNQFYQLHVEKIWGDEVSFETEEVYKKRVESCAELGMIERLAGMTNFTRHSPIGKMFYNPQNKNKIMNYPQYVNPFWSKQKKIDKIKEYGGEQSLDFKIFIKGEVVEDGIAEFDMERVRKNYLDKKQIKSFEITKGNFSRFENIIIVERPKTADRVFLGMDVGESAGSEIIIVAENGNNYNYLYNITLYNLTDKQQTRILDYLIDCLNLDVVALDCGDGTGRAIFRSLEEHYSRDNLVWYDGSKKIEVDFDKDEFKNVIFKAGKPLYKEEYMSEWSVKRLKILLYEQRCKLPLDYKLDAQFNAVISMKSGTRTSYACPSGCGDHLFDAWRVFAIAQWLKKDFNQTQPLSSDWCTGVIG